MTNTWRSGYMFGFCRHVWHDCGARYNRGTCAKNNKGTCARDNSYSTDSCCTRDNCCIRDNCNVTSCIRQVSSYTRFASTRLKHQKSNYSSKRTASTCIERNHDRFFFSPHLEKGQVIKVTMKSRRKSSKHIWFRFRQRFNGVLPIRHFRQESVRVPWSLWRGTTSTCSLPVTKWTWWIRDSCTFAEPGSRWKSESASSDVCPRCPSLCASPSVLGTQSPLTLSTWPRQVLWNLNSRWLVDWLFFLSRTQSTTKVMPCPNTQVIKPQIKVGFTIYVTCHFKAPIHFLTQSQDPISRCGRPVE